VEYCFPRQLRRKPDGLEDEKMMNSNQGLMEAHQCATLGEPMLRGDLVGLAERPTADFSLSELARTRPSVAQARPLVSSEKVNLDELYAEFQPLIRRLIRQYGDSAEMRQDLAGEIYCRFHALVEAYDASRGIPVRPYLVRQLTASIYTYARQGWRRKKREISLDMSSGFCEPAQYCNPSEEWDNRIAMEKVLQGLPDAISKLPKRQRQVVIWRYYDQRPFEEIALILNVQTATARSLLRHGLNNLRRRIHLNESMVV
jgi:RNA polymerase sigma factor (sigma-70 family)